MKKTLNTNNFLNELNNRLQTLKNISKKRTLLPAEVDYRNTLINQITKLSLIQTTNKVKKVTPKKPVQRIVKNEKELFINGIMVKNSSGKVVVQKGSLAYVEYQNILKIKLRNKASKEKALALKKAKKERDLKNAKSFKIVGKKLVKR